MNVFRRFYDWVFLLIRRLYDWVLSWADTKYGTPALFGLAFVESSVFPVPPDVLQIALSASKPKRAFWYATVSLAGSVAGAFLGFLIGYAFWVATQNFFYNYVFSRETFAVVAGDEMAEILVYRSDIPEELHKIEIVCDPLAKARLHTENFEWTQESAELPELWRGIKFFNPPELTKKHVLQFSRTDETGEMMHGGEIISILFYGKENQIFDSFDRETTLGLYHEHGFWAILITAPTPIPYKLFTIAAGVCGISLWVLFIASILGRGARFYAVAAVMYFFGPTVVHWIDKYFNLMMILFAILVVLGLVAIPYLKHFA